jgi:hypothetical protein
MSVSKCCHPAGEEGETEIIFHLSFIIFHSPFKKKMTPKDVMMGLNEG